MTNWRPVVAAIVGTGVSGMLLSLDFWSEARQSLLVALSVIAAAVLVRLARGLPFTNPEIFEVEEIRSVVRAVHQVMRSLKVLIMVIFASFLLLILAAPLEKAALKLEFAQNYGPSIDALLSALIGLLLAYVFVRIIDVVRGDYDLVSLQGLFMVRAVERRQGKRFEEHQNAPGASPFQTPEGYGRRI
jgi:ABC-type amino acid transport system permease subunit